MVIAAALAASDRVKPLSPPIFILPKVWTFPVASLSTFPFSSLSSKLLTPGIWARVVNNPATFPVFMALAIRMSLASPPIPAALARVATPPRTSPLSNAWYAKYALDAPPRMPGSPARMGAATRNKSAGLSIFPAAPCNATLPAATYMGGAPAAISITLATCNAGPISCTNAPIPDLL